MSPPQRFFKNFIQILKQPLLSIKLLGRFGAIVNDLIFRIPLVQVQVEGIVLYNGRLNEAGACTVLVVPM